MPFSLYVVELKRILIIEKQDLFLYKKFFVVGQADMKRISLLSMNIQSISSAVSFLNEFND